MAAAQNSTNVVDPTPPQPRRSHSRLWVAGAAITAANIGIATVVTVVLLRRPAPLAEAIPTRSTPVAAIERKPQPAAASPWVPESLAVPSTPEPVVNGRGRADSPIFNVPAPDLRPDQEAIRPTPIMPPGEKFRPTPEFLSRADAKARQQSVVVDAKLKKDLAAAEFFLKRIKSGSVAPGVITSMFVPTDPTDKIKFPSIQSKATETAKQTKVIESIQTARKAIEQGDYRPYAGPLKDISSVGNVGTLPGPRKVLALTRDGVSVVYGIDAFGSEDALFIADPEFARGVVVGESVPYPHCVVIAALDNRLPITWPMK
ncbi:MAG: hypothetical protein ACRCZF_23040 [Gemmataceae bacterium]